MICNKCGTQNNDNSRYCLSCGNELVQNVQPIPSYGQPINNFSQPVQQPMYGQTVYMQQPVKKNNTAGLVIGIIAGVLVFFFVVGVLARKTNPVAGKWNCKSFNGTNASGDYLMTINFKYDKKFSWEKYNDGKDNYVTGKYTVKKVDKSNNNTDYKYYSIELKPEKYINNGEEKQAASSTKYEIGIIDSKDGHRQAIMINNYSYNMYYCYED